MKEVFNDPGTDNWQTQWFLDGEKATVTNTPAGMVFETGPVADGDASHGVLWTKQGFTGDIRVEYDFTRLDSATEHLSVCIIYLQSTGTGVGPHVEDILAWRDLRRVPAMSLYFNHMNCYHISYACSGGTDYNYVDKNADAILNDTFTFYDQTDCVPRRPDGGLEWTHRGPSNDEQWAMGLNRHGHMGILLNAVEATGNRDYVRMLDAHIRDWAGSVAFPGKHNYDPPWGTGLDVSFRAKYWSWVFYGLQNEPMFTPAARLLLLTRLPEHGHYLRHWHANGNWVTMEMSGLAAMARGTVGMAGGEIIENTADAIRIRARMPGGQAFTVRIPWRKGKSTMQ